MDKSSTDFKWVQNLGTRLFERVSFSIGESIIDAYTFCRQCGMYHHNVNDADWFCAKCLAYNDPNASPKICQ